MLYYHLFSNKEPPVKKISSLKKPSNNSMCSIYRLMLLFIVSALITTSIFTGNADAEPLIRSVEINGNKKIEEATILSKIKSSVGTPFSANTVQKDIKSIYSIGYFDDVSVEVDPFEGGIKLIYNLKEKPTIISIDFQGNEKYDAEKLREKITLSSGAIASPPLISDNVDKITSFYRSEGYWHAVAIPVIREVSDDTVALTFQIDEGKKVVVKSITFEGNDNVSSRKIRKAMMTKKRWLFSFVTGSGYYNKDISRGDVERIRALYNSRGYLKVVISEPETELNDEKTKVSIRISISEGKQYSTGDISFVGSTVFNEIELMEDLETSSGEIFNKSALRSDIDRIINRYTEKGYAGADINPKISIDDRANIANIIMSVTEGSIFHIGRVEISGNTKTRDKVIRREVRLDEGDTYNSKLLKRSYQRINNLNYFEEVNITPLPKFDTSLIDLHVKVKEKLTGMLSFGGGYSSVDKFMVMGEITQANLFGKGLFLKFKAELSDTRTNYNISLRDPWFMDKPISASISLYNQMNSYPEYDKISTGGSLGFGKEFTEYISGNIIYNFESVEVADVSEEASSIISDQKGISNTSSISPSLWRDTRDNYLDPTTGSKIALYSTVAGLGGDNYFVKGVIDAGRYWPLFWDTVFSLRGRAGYAIGFNDVSLPVYERFYLGGINTIRGLSFGEAGPRDETTGEMIGGNKEVILNTELIFPLFKEAKLKGVVFFDAGYAYPHSEDITFDKIRTTAGFGIRWTSPFGPVRLEWGFNLDKKPDENANKIEFTMGGVF